MPLARTILLPAVVVLAAAMAACGNPPDREMQQAQGAIDAARAVGAEQYAAGEFLAAQDALIRAGEAVALRDYRLALNHALDSRERAQNAAKLAADAKAAARVDADHALSRMAAEVAGLQGKLKAAEATRTPARVLTPARQAIVDGEQRLQEARAAFEMGDYAQVVGAETPATEALAAAARALDTATAPATRRRR
jgi:hypothetical protein